MHASHPKTRLRVRLELRGAAPIALTGVSWSWDGLGEAVAGSAGCEEGGILVGRALRYVCVCARGVRVDAGL